MAIYVDKNSNPGNKIPDWLFWFILVSLLGCIIYTSYNVGKRSVDKQLYIQYVDTCLCDRDTLSIDNVYYEIKRLNIKYPDIVLAQCILETGSLKSNVCNSKNNLFGFQTSKGYLNFNNWKESVTFYKNWQNKYYKGGNYFDFLRNIGYSETSNYTDMVKYIASTFKK